MVRQMQDHTGMFLEVITSNAVFTLHPVLMPTLSTFGSISLLEVIYDVDWHIGGRRADADIGLCLSIHRGVYRYKLLDRESVSPKLGSYMFYCD